MPDLQPNGPINGKNIYKYISIIPGYIGAHKKNENRNSFNFLGGISLPRVWRERERERERCTTKS